MADTVERIVTADEFKGAIVKYINDSSKLKSWGKFRVTEISVNIPERFIVEYCEGVIELNSKEIPYYIDELQMVSISKKEIYYILTRNFAPAPNLVANKIKHKDKNFPADVMMVGVKKAGRGINYNFF